MKLTVYPVVTATGLWCDDCLLPSRVAVDVVTLSDDGVTVIGRMTCCEGCEPC